MPVANMIQGHVLRLTALVSTTTVLFCVEYYKYTALVLLAGLAVLGRRSLYMCFHFSWFRRWLLLQLPCAILLSALFIHLAFLGSLWAFGVIVTLLWAEAVGQYLNAENVRSFATTYGVPREHGDEEPD